jgi:hypothetical protein
MVCCGHFEVSKVSKQGGRLIVPLINCLHFVSVKHSLFLLDSEKGQNDGQHKAVI